MAHSWSARLKRDAIVLTARALRGLPHNPIKRRLMMRVATTGLFVGGYAHPFVVTTPFGATLHGNTRDMLQAHLFAFGQWEPHLTAWIPSRLAPGDTFVDVGANIGYFSLLAARAVGPSGRVVAVEALPATHDHLRWHVTTNGARQVRTVSCAAAAESGTLVLHAGPEWNSGMSSSVPPAVWQRWTGAERGSGSSGDMNADFGEPVEVEARPLDAILTADERARARLVKVDVEGAEIAAVHGMRDLLAHGRRDLEVVVEVNPGLLAADGQRTQDLFEPFLREGFRAYAFPIETTEGYLEHRPQPPRRLPGIPDSITEVVFSRIL